MGYNRSPYLKRMAVQSPKQPATELRRVLCLRLRSMGDAVLMTPALGALRRSLPGAEIHMVLDRDLVALFDGHPFVDRILALGSGSGAKASLAVGMRRFRFDAVINFHGGPTSAWLTAAARAPLRVGRDTYRCGFLYNVKVGKPEHVFANPLATHTVHVQASLVAALGVPVEDFSLRIGVSNRARRALVERLAGVGVQGRRYIVLQPSASFPSKQWPADRFVDVGRELRRRMGCEVVVSLPPPLGRSRTNLEDGVRRMLDRRSWPRDRTINPVLTENLFASEFPVLTGLPLDELAALLEGASLYLGNDSGPMHLAAALGTPVVAIFGSSDPRRWHPWGAPSRVLSAGLDCSPCHGKWCVHPQTFACLDTVEVRAVIQAAFDLLASKARPE